MTEKQHPLRSFILAGSVFLGGVLLWALLSGLRILQPSIFPSPVEVATGLVTALVGGPVFVWLVKARL